MLTHVLSLCTNTNAVEVDKEIPPGGMDVGRFNAFIVSMLICLTRDIIAPHPTPPPTSRSQNLPEMSSRMYNYQLTYSLLDLIFLGFHFVGSAERGLFLELVSLQWCDSVDMFRAAGPLMMLRIPFSCHIKIFGKRDLIFQSTYLCGTDTQLIKCWATSTESPWGSSVLRFIRFEFLSTNLDLLDLLLPVCNKTPLPKSPFFH